MNTPGRIISISSIFTQGVFLLMEEALIFIAVDADIIFRCIALGEEDLVLDGMGTG